MASQAHFLVFFPLIVADPYVTMGLILKKGKEDRKSTTIKPKTLNPTWHETFTFEIESKRQGFTLHDHDPVGADDPLGVATIDISSLPDNVEQDMWLPLQGVETGVLHVSLCWRPDPENVRESKLANRPYSAKEKKIKDVVVLREENRRLREMLVAWSEYSKRPPNISDVQEALQYETEKFKSYLCQVQATVYRQPYSNPLVFGQYNSAPFIDFDWTGYPPSEFGQAMRDNYFLVNSGFLNACNATPPVFSYFAASYGALPKPVLDAIDTWTRFIQKDPMMFRLTVLPLQMQKVCEFIKADVANFSFLLNANAATSSVVKSIAWRPGDRIIVYNIDYEATHNACAWLKKYKAVETVEIDLDLPLSQQEILDITYRELSRIVSSGPLPRLFNFCHVTSRTGYLFPAKELVQLIHQFNIPVSVDGAQAPGHVPINVAEIGAEFYIGTLHKWCFTAQGSGFIVALPHTQSGLTPLTVSPFFGSGFAKEFQYTGMQDWALWCSIEQSFEFVEKVCGGWDRIWQYGKTFADSSVHYLENAWHTKNFQPPGLGNRLPIVPIPLGVMVPDSVVKQIMAVLAMHHNLTCFLVLIPIKGVPTVGVRISCQVYNDMDEIEKLAKVVTEMGGRYTSLRVIRDLITS